MSQMTLRDKRGAGAQSSGQQNGTASAKSKEKEVIERIKEATGASEEDVTAMLKECNYDVNDTTNKLIDSKCFEGA